MDSISVLGRSPGERKGYHSSILAWRIPWTVQSMELQWVRLNWETFTFTSVSDCVKNQGPRKPLDCLLLIMTTSEWNGNQRSNRNQSLRNPKWWAETGGGRQLLSGGGLAAKSCQTLVTPWTVACQAPLSMGFSRQEYWSGLPFPSPGDLPDLGIKPRSSALQEHS